MTRKIQYSEPYLRSSPCTGFLYYPSYPFDLAVTWSGIKTVVKPIIQITTDGGYFVDRGKSMYLRNFREEGEGTIVPNWAIEWIQERIAGKPYKINLRMSEVDKFILEGAIKGRINELQHHLGKIDECSTGVIK